MKVVIPGGSGQVGTIPARAFHANGAAVVVLSRRPEADTWRFSIDVARAWERTFSEAFTRGTRKVALRSAMIARNRFLLQVPFVGERRSRSVPSYS